MVGQDGGKGSGVKDWDDESSLGVSYMWFGHNLVMLVWTHLQGGEVTLVSTKISFKATGGQGLGRQSTHSSCMWFDACFESRRRLVLLAMLRLFIFSNLVFGPDKT